LAILVVLTWCWLGRSSGTRRCCDRWRGLAA
jgi:hypothetical protein